MLFRSICLIFIKHQPFLYLKAILFGSVSYTHLDVYKRQPETYMLKLVVLIIGCMFFGLSIAFMVSADVILSLIHI